MRKLAAFLLSGFIATCSFAQPAAEQAAIKNLCGCYEVDFKYAETFAADTGYKFRPRYHVSGLEWVVANEATDKKFVLQHLLVIDDSTIIKHWREDWEFEKSDWWKFNYNADWKHVVGNRQATKGQWTQTVWEVDDAPRYQGSGKWVNSNGKYYWENTTDAPLPRREYTKRSDYNVMQRTNRIVITDTGWVHEQDNKKLLRKDGATDVFLAEEKGYNTYRKTADNKCKQAAAWWAGHKQFWDAMRQSWEELMKDRSEVHLVSKVDGKLLYQQLDTIENEHITGLPLKAKLKEVLMKYIDSGDSKTATASAEK